MPEIALIGAGSVVFAKTLLGDILQTPALADSHIRLMDIDPARLKVAGEMVGRMIATLGVRAKVSTTLDRTRAIRGAQFVICAIQVGGHDPGTTTDFEIPKKYGLNQTIGDTLGIGGIFRGLRTIPELLKIARDIADVGAPGCLLLNYTNPMAMLCRAVDRETGIPCAGMCHSIQGTARQLAAYAALDQESVTYRVAGINHMAFFLDFRSNGRDAYPLLFRLLDDPAFHSDRVRFEMMRRTGYFVTESSEHQAEYTPYFIPHGDALVKEFQVPIGELIRRNTANIASWEKTERELLGPQNGTMPINPRGHEYASFIIEAMTAGTPCVVYANLPNRGLLPNLPPGCIVEVPTLVDANGIQPTSVHDFPEVLAALCRTNINVQELTVEAALSGRREAIYHAAMLDPLTSATLPLDRIWAMCDELIEAHQKHGLLAGFRPTLPSTGRAAKGISDSAVARLRPIGPADPAPGARQVLELSLEPGADFAVGTALRFSFSASAGGIVPEVLEVPAEPNGRARIEVVFPDGFSQSARVDMQCDDPLVLCIGTVLRERRVIRSNGEPVLIELAGFPAARAEFHDEDGRIAIRVEVNDSNIQPVPASPWEGSAVELFFASDEAPHPAQFLLVPFPEDHSVRLFAMPGLHEIVLEGSSLEVQPLSYAAHIHLPRTALPSGCLLVDLIADIGALGDAHSGGRAALNGRLDSHATSDHFSVLA